MGLRAVVAAQDKVIRQSREKGRRLRMIADSIPAVVVHLDADLHFTFANTSYCDWHGIESKDIIGRHIRDIVGPDTFEVIEPKMAEVLAGNALTFEAELTYHSVGKRIVQIDYVPDVTNEGEVVGLYSMAQNITERRRAEEALAQSERRMKTVFEAGPTISSITTIKEGRFLEVNKAYSAKTGYSRDEIVGRTVSELGIWVVPENRGKVVDAIERDGHIQDFEASFYKKDGGVFPVIYNGVTIDIEGETHLLSIAIDITERKQAEADILAAMKAAEKADQTKSEFLANMSHELRTPLNAILGFSDMVRQETFGPIGNLRYGSYLNDIHNSGQHLLSLINDILDISRIESGYAEIDDSVLDVAQIVEECVLMAGLRAVGDRRSVEVLPAPGLPQLRADQRMVKQMLINLISNAIKFTEVGDRISIIAKLANDDQLQLIVRDTGIGIAKKDMTKAMSTFGQVDATWSRKFEGTGLGLPLVKSLAELHDGGLEISSQPGVGTEATIWFPAGRTTKS